MTRRTHFFVGTSGWSYPHWKGAFYPQGLPQRHWFDYYASHFDTVEVNATFYRHFPDQTFRNWRAKAPEGFRYVLKVPQLISHRKQLAAADEQIDEFVRQAGLLGDRLGPLLLQLPPQMTPGHERLAHALERFGNQVQVAVEFRHPDWMTPQTRELLRSHHAIFCSAQSPKSSLLDWVTTETAYIRLHGRTRWYDYEYSAAELQEIARLARRMATQGAKSVYIFFNNDSNAWAPRNAAALKELLSINPVTK